MFAHRQTLEDPRDGLALFGPLDEGKPFGIRFGLIGTQRGIALFRAWATKVQAPVFDQSQSHARPMFPGFEAVFRIPWQPEPTIQVEVSQRDIRSCIHLRDGHHRVYQTVDLFRVPIVDSLKQDDRSVDIWFVVIPDEIYKYGRPKSVVDPDVSIASKTNVSRSLARRLLVQSSMFPEDHEAALPYYFDINFHHQLKARLLENLVPTQILLESTLAHGEDSANHSARRRSLGSMQSAIAWNLTTTAFYKAGGRPWRLGDIRDGVCYLGLVFKRDQANSDPRTAACAAQMFLDSGDGVVFKGAVGPWYSPKHKEFHMSREAAKELVHKALESYTQLRGRPPDELFLHGKVRFDDEEWLGFRDAAGPSTSLVGIRIREDSDLKLYRKASHPVLRGIAYVRDPRTAFLWTKGFIPRLQTYPGREVPRPLLIDVCRGEIDIAVVLRDIMALTKLNYNACIFADGLPVTLRFADAVGEILTSGPLHNIPPLPFKFYI